MSDTLNICLIILGTAAALLILFAILIGLLGIASSILEKWFHKGEQAQWEMDARRMRDLARWFGEDKATMNLLVNASYDGKDPSSMRDQWRKDRIETPPQTL